MIQKRKLICAILVISLLLNGLAYSTINNHDPKQYASSSIHSETSNSIHLLNPKTSIAGALIKLLILFLKNLLEIISNLFRFIGDIITTIFRFIADVLGAIVDGIRWILDSIADGFKWILDSIADGFKWILRLFDNSIDNVEKILNSVDTGLHTLEFDSLTETQKAFSNEPVATNMSVFVSLPKTKNDLTEVITNAEAFELASTEISNTIEILDKLHSANKIIVTDLNKESSTKSFIDILSQSNSSYVTIIGHNNRGSFRMFGSGENSISIEKMSKLCVNFSKRCIFLSCNSADFINNNDMSAGMMWELSYLQAANIVETISKEFGDKNTMFLSEISGLLLRQEISIHIKPKVKFVITSGTGTGMGFAGISYFNDKRKSTLTKKSSGRKKPRR